MSCSSGQGSPPLRGQPGAALAPTLAWGAAAATKARVDAWRRDYPAAAMLEAPPEWEAEAHNAESAAILTAHANRIPYSRWFQPDIVLPNGIVVEVKAGKYPGPGNDGKARRMTHATCMGWKPTMAMRKNPRLDLRMVWVPNRWPVAKKEPGRRQSATGASLLLSG